MLCASEGLPHKQLAKKLLWLSLLLAACALGRLCCSCYAVRWVIIKRHMLNCTILACPLLLQGCFLHIWDTATRNQYKPSQGSELPTHC